MKTVLTTSGFVLLCAVAGSAQAVEVTANAGYMSEYIFRGISQSDSKKSATAASSSRSASTTRSR